MQRPRSWTAGVALGALCIVVVQPATAVGALRYASDLTLLLGGATVPAGAIVEDDLAGTVTPVGLGPVPAGVLASNYHVLGSGEQLFSTDVTTTLPGGITVGPADVVRLSGGTYVLEFDAAAAGVPPGVATDAVSVAAAGDLLLSFDVTVTLGALAIDDEDLVSWDGNGFAMVFDGSVAGVPTELDLDAAERDGSTGHLLLSFDGGGAIGSVVFDDEDVLEFVPGAGTWALAYDGSAEHAGWPNGDLTALAITGTCGNGTVEGAEACDAGVLNGTLASCCTTSCALQPAMTTCAADGNPCTDDMCNGIGDACEHAANAAPCDDGDACTGGDSCSGGACAGTALPDADTDGWCDGADNCPGIANPTQSDGDGDGDGDACDNCPGTPNPDQRNADGCATFPGKACPSGVFPTDGAEGGDACDLCPAATPDTCEQAASGAAVVGPDGSGGPIVVGAVLIEVPPGAVASDTTFSVTQMANADYALGNRAFGKVVYAVTLEPEGVVFDPPVSVVFSWIDGPNGKVVGTNIFERRLAVWRNENPLTYVCEDARSDLPICNTVAGCFDETACTAACCDAGLPGGGPNTWTLGLKQFSEYALVDEPCPPEPLPGCTVPFVAGKARVQVTDKSEDAGDKFNWKWLAGGATPLDAFGSPTTDPGTDYAMCVYAGAPAVLVGRGTLRAGGTCGTPPCWQAAKTRGFDYRDRGRLPDGLDTAKLRAGIAGKALLQVKGKGRDLLMAAPPLSLPVRVQLQASNGACWESVHSTALRNVPGLFKARAD